MCAILKNTEMAQGFSIIEYFSLYDGYSCGYCKSPNTNCSHQLWAHRLTVQDYQDLIDRGWRRSGCVCYKPVLNLVCCPMYTIKCEALNFKTSKSQRKVLRKMGKFLRNELSADKSSVVKQDERNAIDVNMRDVLQDRECPDEVDEHSINLQVLPAQNSTSAPSSKIPRKSNTVDRDPKLVESIHCKSENKATTPLAKTSTPLESTSSKGPCRKAKLIRIDRKRNKLLAQGKTLEEIEAMFQARKKLNQPKTFEELFDESTVGSKRLELKLVSVTSGEFKRTFKASLELYRKYQVTIHKDAPEECTEKSFYKFLVKSPLKHWQPNDGPPHGYGSFHEQYWLDNKLIAVAVIDILPSCVSSVYFFYDPEYSHLTLGTYSSLREVYLTRQLNKVANNIKYYFMGFYIHSCPKMRYKGRLRPSKLLCPETYSWFDIESCIAKLNKHKYSRFNDDIDAIDENGSVNIKEVLILYGEMGMAFEMYEANVNLGLPTEEKDEIQEYANLVGKKCAPRMLLYRRPQNS